MGLSDRFGTAGAIIDASSTILLAKAGLLDACCAALPIVMTPSVAAEASIPRRTGSGAIRRLIDEPGGIALLDDPESRLADAVMADLARLHRGERDTLHHCLDGRARFVIIDDGKAVQFCRRYHIAHINALLCPRLLCFCGRLASDEAAVYFSRLTRLGRYSADVAAWAERCRPADLDYFLAFMSSPHNDPR